MTFVSENWEGINVRLPKNRAKRRDWPRAFRSMDKLLENGEDTQQAFEIVEALSGPSLRQSFRKFLSSPQGREIFARRVELAERLDDHAWLKSLPEESFGRAYLEFVTSEGLSATGLVEESHKVANSQINEMDNDFAWYSRRIRDVHDLWHVLTGYGRDGLGELSLLAFTYSQTKSLGALFIAYMGGRSSRKHTGERDVMRVIWQAKRDGRAADFLPGMDYLSALEKPLADVRKQFGVPVPEQYLALRPAYIRKVETLMAG